MNTDRALPLCSNGSAGLLPLVCAKPCAMVDTIILGTAVEVDTKKLALGRRRCFRRDKGAVCNFICNRCFFVFVFFCVGGVWWVECTAKVGEKLDEKKCYVEVQTYGGASLGGRAVRPLE